MDFKPPLTLEKQIDKLKRFKRVVFIKIDEEHAKDYLHKYNYTNLITPFKYYFCKWKNDEEVDKDCNNNHIYERDVDFFEYVDRYKTERENYINIYRNISKFETIFKSVLAYRILINYNITNETSFDNFVDDLRKNTGNTEKSIKRFDNYFGTHYREVCNKYFDRYKKCLINQYNSNIYVFFDNLSLGSATAIYNCCNIKTRKEIFEDLKKYHVSFDYNDYYMFGQKLLIIVAIRNKVYHSSSVEIAIKFHDIKKKEIRHVDGPFSQVAYRNVLKKLIV